jgi:hypothetical protein
MSSHSRAKRLCFSSVRSAVVGLIIGIAMVAFCAASADASVTYDYTGNDFTQVTSPYTISDNITGSFTLANPLGSNLTFPTPVTPLAFTFSDGVQTISQATTGVTASFDFSTDGAGGIASWQIEILAPSANSPGHSNEIFTSNIGVIAGNVDLAVFFTPEGNRTTGENFGMPGNSPAISAVPEPSTWLLMILGFMGFGFMAYRRKQNGAVLSVA